MPHFQPAKSTTSDVVRGAIIPLSRATEFGNVAYAVAAGGGQTMLAERMVTHSWNNLFCNLVAAVVADALDRPVYGQIAQQLAAPGGARTMRARLAESGCLEIRYWICAFSVNQHSSICGSLGQPPPEGTRQRQEWELKSRDTITKELFELCPCDEPKYFNDAGPLCELNKFEQMMAHLAEVVPQMRQIVAVDQDFEIFSRAWCIAEINQALSLGIDQVLKLPSAEAVQRRGVEVQSIRVEECQASRAEDRDAILEKIPDLDAFNARMHAAIFGQAGLLQQALDGATEAAWLGNVARRALLRRGRSAAAI